MGVHKTTSALLLQMPSLLLDTNGCQKEKERQLRQQGRPLTLETANILELWSSGQALKQKEAEGAYQESEAARSQQEVKQTWGIHDETNSLEGAGCLTCLTLFNNHRPPCGTPSSFHTLIMHPLSSQLINLINLFLLQNHDLEVSGRC